MIIALASPCIAATPDEGLDKIKRFLSEASAQGAEIVCFPEAYLPGLRGQDFEVVPLALSRDGAMGGGAGRQNRFSSPPHGE
jgi:predicted amidohydrolase